ncbi:single-stranded DNA-binding protein [Streptosporangium sp. NPDC002721]|uniref:single-stranded DNA-binding protein n=1 Tax=Streptosporangium sp. NPDC002721 TaxID=3366188 RepID=UPI003695BC9F
MSSTSKIEGDRMDRNEVILVGRLPEVAQIRSLPSGSRLGTWRLIVRRQHHGRGARVDTIPCASFELEVIEAVAGWLPDDVVEVTGSLRRRWWGSEGAKSSGYEVEVRSARRLERRVTTILTGEEEVPVPAPPRPVRSLMHTGQRIIGQETAGREGPGQDAEPRLTPVGPDPTPDLTAAGPGLPPAGLDTTLSESSNSAPVGSDLVGPDSASVRSRLVRVGLEPDPVGSDPLGLDSALVRPGLVPVETDRGPAAPDPLGLDPDSAGPGLTPVGRDPASAGFDDLPPARSGLDPEGMPVPVPRVLEAPVPGRSQMPHLATRADAVS